MEDKKSDTPKEFGPQDAYNLLNRNFMNLTRFCRENNPTPAIDMKPQAKEIIKILLQDGSNVPLLVGESGIKKRLTTVEVAKMLISHNLPFDFQDKELYYVNTHTLLMKSLDNPEYPQFLEMVVRSAGMTKAILFIDNMCKFCELNFNENYAAEKLFLTGLNTDDFHVIAGTPTQKADCLMHHSAFSSDEGSIFTPVTIANPGTEESLTLVRHIQPKMESDPPGVVRITEDAISAALNLCQQSFPNQSLPEKAVELLSTAKNDVLIEKELKKSGKRGRPSKSVPVVDGEQVQQTASRVLKSLASASAKMDRSCLTSLDASLRVRVIGQDEAIRAVSDALRLYAAGLKEPNKPKGVFLFAGSTGTGKTEMAKALAESLYGSTERLVRIDMSEYTEYHNVSRLFGSPPGYVGFEGGGQLTNAIEKTPDCVVLLDEIEKAHPMVLNTFLQVFDDGRLTDGHGRTYSFRNAVIIMTTNLGAGALSQLQPKRIGFCEENVSAYSENGKEQYQRKVLEAVRANLLPEFLNRITKTIVFNPLDQGTLHAILEKTLQKKLRLIEDRHIQLELDDEVRDLIEKEGFNPLNGAREMERTIDRLLMQPLADFLLDHEGLVNTTLQALLKEDKIVISEKTTA